MIKKFELSAEDNKMCRKVFWRTMSLSATYNYETMQALGFMYAMIPVINRFYTNEEDRKKALIRHNEIFNTTPTMAGMITGLVASMEKEAANDPSFDTSSISAVKVSLMGPFAGIGDSLFQGTIRIISLGIGVSLAMSGSLLGAVVHLVLYNALAHILRYYGVFASYKLGSDFMKKATESGLMSSITKAATIVGIMTVGAMVCTMINFNIPMVLNIQGSELVVQDVLDQLFPNLLPLLLTFGCYKGIKKGINPAIIMLLLLALGVVGKYLGVF